MTAGLTVGNLERQADDEVPVNVVISQNPDRDLFVDPEASVDLVISLGKPEVPVPFVINMTKKEARTTLEDVNLEAKFVEQESDLPKGVIISTDPAAGVTVEEGATITAYFSDGPETVPNVVGLSERDATRKLEDANFRVNVVESNNTTEAAGTVIDQSPASGETAALNATITIVVSTFVEPPPPPASSPTADPSASATP